MTLAAWADRARPQRDTCGRQQRTGLWYTRMRQLPATVRELQPSPRRTGNVQALMVAEAWDRRAGLLAGLDECAALLDLDLFAVDLELDERAPAGRGRERARLGSPQRPSTRRPETATHGCASNDAVASTQVASARAQRS